jgi:hypothetical protein
MKWISIQESLPPVDWFESGEGRLFSPRVVLLKRTLETRGGARQVVSVGEYDNTGIPEQWRTWDDFVNDDGYEDCDSRVVEDVTHWMEIPDFSDEDREMVRCKVGEG